MKSDNHFINNLGRIYGVYTGGFIGFVIVLAILEQFGVSNKIIGYLFVGLTILIYAVIGIMTRTTKVSEYYVAGRLVPPVFNGMATGADWMSGASFVGLAGTLYILGYDGLGFVIGWTGGYILVAVLLAPFLRKFGAYTIPDFIGARYQNRFAEIVAIIVLFSCSFTYVTAQIYATGIISSRFLGISFELAVFVGLAGILVCSMLGGMRAVTWTQVAQYIILIIAYLAPVVMLSVSITGVPIPQLMYGTLLQEISQIEAELNIKDYVQPYNVYDSKNFFLLIVCLMIGTASLPHVLMRFFTTPSVRSARKSVAWSLFFIFILYFTAPAYAAFARYEILTNVVGQNIASLPDWVNQWQNVAGLVSINDLNADGILQFSELKISRDIIVLATPEIAGLPYIIAGLVAAGGLAAALSTADGLLLAIANAISHDIYYKIINPKADAKTRLIIARVILIIVAIVAAITASTQPADILKMVAWAFSIAGSGLFAALVLGVWWKRTSSSGALWGMILGYVSCLFYLVVSRYFPEAGVANFGMSVMDEAKGIVSNNVGYWGVKNISAGTFGIPIAFITTIVISLITKPPSAEMQDFVERLRIPSGRIMKSEE